MKKLNFAFLFDPWRVSAEASLVDVAKPPRPIGWQIQNIGGRTHIARVWRLGDGKRCKLCPQCSATVNDDGKTALCLISVNREIGMYEAEMFNCSAKPKPKVDPMG